MLIETLLLIGAAAVVSPLQPSHAQTPRAGDPLVGSWQGVLDVSGTRARLGLKVERDTAGGVRGSLVNLDAANIQLPATFTARGDTLTITIAGGQATYVGTLSAAKDTLRGTFSQMGAVFPVAFGRVQALSGTTLTFPARLAPDADIRALLKKRVDDQQRTVGVVVGVIDPGGRRIVTYGRRAKGDATPLDGNTVFEIGSVTKVFTTLVLADMVRRGEVALDDPAVKYLPPGSRVPERNGKQITLLQLATHTSGLPRDATNMPARDASNPFAGFTIPLVSEFLASYTLPRDPGASYEYSNVGMGFLGNILARRAGMTYEELVRSRVTDRLGMPSTRASLEGDVKARAATGHTVALDAVPPLEIPGIQGAGVLRSSANDMLTFLSAELGLDKTPLASAMSDALATRRPTGVSNLDVALAWHITTLDGHEMVWHNGGTPGFRTFVGFDRARHVGIVALSNSGAAEGVDDIGLYLLSGGGPLYDRAPVRTVALDAAVFDGYAGRYEISKNFVLTLSREGTRFYVQATNQPRFEIFASAPREFFLKAIDAQLTVEADAAGKGTVLILHQNGRDQRGPRIAGP